MKFAKSLIFLISFLLGYSAEQLIISIQDLMAHSAVVEDIKDKQTKVLPASNARGQTYLTSANCWTSQGIVTSSTLSYKSSTLSYNSSGKLIISEKLPSTVIVTWNSSEVKFYPIYIGNSKK